MSRVDWHQTLREKFPALRRWTYLDSAAAGPIAEQVARAGREVYDSLLTGGDADWEAHLAATERAREALAQLAGCRPVEVAFTRNTSHSTAMIAQMLWESGARVAVALEDEFPASTIPFLHRGFEVRFVRPEEGRYPLERVAEKLSGADVLVASQVMYRTGQANDAAALGRLARDRDATFVLCATQALGALQVDFAASGADFLTGTSHKWLCAGYGGGYLAMREDLFGRYRWPVAGWMSAADPDAMHNDRVELANAARVLELGCQPFPVLLALGEACRLWLETGPERVEARVRALTRSLRERLTARGMRFPENEEAELSGITIVPHPSAKELCDALRAEGIATTPRGSGIRVAVHAFNDESDLDRLVHSLERRGVFPR